MVAMIQRLLTVALVQVREVTCVVMSCIRLCRKFQKWTYLCRSSGEALLATIVCVTSGSHNLTSY